MSYYGTTAGADAYHTARGNSTWTGLDAVKEVALLRASEYLDARYESLFSGFPVDRRAQVRSWPRSDAFDIYDDAIPADEIPVEVEHATYEFALIELVTPGRLTPVVTQSDRKKAVAVSGAVSVTYADAAGIEAYRPVITAVDGVLAPLLVSESAGSFLAGRIVRS